jgi:hypothetical protein
VEHSAMCEAEQSLAGDGPTPHCDEIYSLTTRVTASPATVSQNERILLANPEELEILPHIQLLQT